MNGREGGTNELQLSPQPWCSTPSIPSAGGLPCWTQLGQAQSSPHVHVDTIKTSSILSSSEMAVALSASPPTQSVAPVEREKLTSAFWTRSCLAFM